MTLSEHPKMIVRGFERATLLAAGLVVLILYASFRNWRDMAVAAVPLIMGSIWMLGSMKPLGQYFNHANMVVLPLLLGLGVDAGVHIMVRYRQSAEDHGGVADIDEMLTSTGGAVLVASMTTIFGFAVMMIAKYRGMVSLGIIMSWGMSATLLLTLMIIPAILLLLKRAR
jgi:predicted RND superfamily exporter protein